MNGKLDGNIKNSRAHSLGSIKAAGFSIKVTSATANFPERTNQNILSVQSSKES